ncbi:hypothetical protein KOI35_37260 [Actinoplanes bogorensis]|uniref:Uncharacterized protein n=1 Tax=Paractinoplanes bogorensis TaxID=1610840 RepID=A0ABS5Z0H9_9ACTN|nr:hypothetical protein [Actinoplanes bogorensis]MBU2669177.1 hypothetical protein [Actinoplanes bogorensis]
MSKSWLIRLTRSPGPPREVRRGIVEAVYVIVWETAHGPVIYAVRLESRSFVDAAALVRELLPPAQRDSAVVLEPELVQLDTLAEQLHAGPHIIIYGPDGSRAGRHLAERIGRTLGADLPVWIRGTNTVATARLLSAHDGPVPLPDDTGWPRCEATLLAAVRAGLPEDCPLAWAALAADHAIVLNQVVAGHARLPDRGPGWYLVARPRPPQPPSSLRLTGVVPPPERGVAAADEVIALRAAAADMERDDPRVPAWTAAATALSQLIRRDVSSDIIAGRPVAPHHDRIQAARLVPAVASWAGPVVSQWLETLIPLPGLPPLHRLDVLRRHTPAGPVRAAYRTRAGLYVLVLEGDVMCAEWPCDPAVAATWTDTTMLAVDPGGPLLAGNDPVPASRGAGGPLTADNLPRMRMVLPLALTSADAAFAEQSFVYDTLMEHPAMTLRPAIEAGTVRLPWKTVRELAAADVISVRRLLDPGEPRYYHYYGIVDSLHGPGPWAVIRRSATPEGHPRDERRNPDGTWSPSHLLSEVQFGRRDDDFIRLTPAEAGRA